MTEPVDQCPIEAVFSDGRAPCVLPRGHDGPHHTPYVVPWDEEEATVPP